MNNIKELLKNKKIVFGAICLLVVIIIIIAVTPKTLTLTKESVLIEGFNSRETIVVKLNGNKISKIKLTREISLNDYYDSLGTYYNSLEKVLNNGYSYLEKNYSIKKEKNKVVVNINTKEKGVVLNNLSIKYNGDDDTTLRYDIETDLKNESSINIGDKISKNQLKQKLKKYGYE